MAETKQHNRGTKFLKDFGIYAIGNLGSRLLTFLMYPLYSFYVGKADYGFYDICMQCCLFFTPLVTLQLRDGAFRFLLENKDHQQRTQIVSYVYSTLFVSIACTILIALLISLIHPIDYLWHTVVLLIIMSIVEVVAQVIRGLESNMAFIAVGLLSSFGIGVFSVIFVVFLKMGVEGIFIANILARIFAVAAVESRIKTITRFFRFKVDTKAISREILKFSLPLIPLTMCGLLPPLLDRFFIKTYLGLDEAGVYAISMRMAGIIHILSMIFYKTWQENAIIQYNSPDRDKFFSKVFNGYVFVLAILLIGYIFCIKIGYSFGIGKEYQSGWVYLLPVGISWVIVALSSYFYIPYQCAKDTKSAVPSVIILVITNFILNYILVPKIGVFGVIVTSTIGYLIVILYLWINTRRFFKLHFDTNTIVPIVMVFFSLIPFYLNPNYFADAIYIVIAELIIIIALPREVKASLIQKIKKVTHKK
ncbi:MAG: lipopolysaccharide biosynthesis protein [Muribaculaceae bacterium]|nr:lipopolysaccharide biosynthesis protein [Muribaculaceae bacterium]